MTSQLSNSTKFELVTSIRAGYATNETQDAASILITPKEDAGVIEVYYKKSSEDMKLLDEKYQFSEYELRWKPLDEKSKVNSFVVKLSCQYEFLRYPEVKDGVVFVLRKKLAYSDRFPYFFWCQESDPAVIDRFLTSMDMSIKNLAKEKALHEEIDLYKPISFSSYIKERNVLSYLDKPGFCERLYPFVPETFRSPTGLRRIINSLSFKRNAAMYQEIIEELEANSACHLYAIDISDLPQLQGEEQGVRSYVTRMEEAAEAKIKQEKECKKQ